MPRTKGAARKKATAEEREQLTMRLLPRRRVRRCDCASPRVDLAATRSDLGGLYRETHRFAEAEAAAKKAADIQRELAAASSPSAAGRI
jgi:hypothetical protein